MGYIYQPKQWTIARESPSNSPYICIKFDSLNMKKYNDHWYTHGIHVLLSCGLLIFTSLFMGNPVSQENPDFLDTYK